MNPSKTKFITISTANNLIVPSPVSRGQAIERVQSHQHLGVTFNDRYTWNDHVNYIVNHVSKRIGILMALKYRLTKSCLRNIYIFHISGLRWNIVTWFGMDCVMVPCAWNWKNCSANVYEFLLASLHTVDLILFTLTRASVFWRSDGVYIDSSCFLKSFTAMLLHICMVYSQN